ncbi:uncharacterized protein LOC134343574 isoform X3 [Mobula hypostoma]|uniref:uncharacterized protein LOC134343574 isoform X3 n=1 Tax=Mobula hypostoma TaxID=723540 RepID=UPI002FC34115
MRSEPWLIIGLCNLLPWLLTRTKQLYINELNLFYARFDVASIESLRAVDTTCSLVISEAEVCWRFQRVDSHKAARPDGIPGRVLQCVHGTTGSKLKGFTAGTSHRIHVISEASVHKINERKDFVWQACRLFSAS